MRDRGSDAQDWCEYETTSHDLGNHYTNHARLQLYHSSNTRSQSGNAIKLPPLSRITKVIAERRYLDVTLEAKCRMPTWQTLAQQPLQLFKVTSSAMSTQVVNIEEEAKGKHSELKDSSDAGA